MPELQPTFELPEDELEQGRGTPEERALTRFQDHVRQNAPIMARLRKEASELSRFVSPRGSQLPRVIYELYETLGLPTLSINDTWPTIMNLAGREVTGRFVPKLVGRDKGDQGFADACNAAVRTVRERNDFEAVDSSAYRQAHIRGYSGTELIIRPRRTTPDFILEKIFGDELLLDFTARGVNMSGSTAYARGSFTSLWQLKARYPEFADVWEKLEDESTGGMYDFSQGLDVWASSLGGSLTEVDGDWTWSSEWSGTGQFHWRERSSCFLINFLWSDSEPRVALRLPGEVAALWEQVAGGELPYDTADLDGPSPIAVSEEVDSLLGALGALTAQVEQELREQQATFQQAVQAAQMQGQPLPEPPQVPPIIMRTITPQQLREFQAGYSLTAFSTFEDYFEIDEDIWWQALIVGDLVLRVKRIGHKIPNIMPLICYHDEETHGQVPYGTALLLRDRQMLSNAFANAFVYAVATMTKAQMVLNKTGLDPQEIEDLEEDITRGAALLKLHNPDALKEAPGRGKWPAGMERAFQLFHSLVPGGVGQSPATLGGLQELSRTAFRLAEQQAATAQKTVAEAEDNLRSYRRTQTKLILSCIFTYWSREDFALAAGEDYAHYIPADRSEWWRGLDFNLIVDEEPVTRHMSMANLEMLTTTGMHQIVPERTLLEVSAPAFGSKAIATWEEDIRNREPMRAAQMLGQALGVDPQLLLQTAQQLAGAPGEEEVA